VTHLTCDHDHKIVYCNFRGELNTGIYQYTTKAQSHMVFMSNFTSPQPIKCFGGMPKWLCDPSTHEVMRFAKCDNAGKLEFISFRLPNRTGLYQPDLYPEMKSQTPSGKYEDWVKGDLMPKTFQITEDYRFAAGEEEEVKL